MGIIGDKELLLKVWEILKMEGPALGMLLNPAKWLNPECKDPCPIELVELVPTEKVQMLGVPLGSPEFVAGFVERELTNHPQGHSTAHGFRRLSGGHVPTSPVIWDCQS